MTRRIDTDEDVAEGCAWLAARCARMGAALALTGPPPLRRFAPGFAGLLRVVTGQQLSVAAAASVWRKVEAAGFADPRALLAAPDEALRACGLSAAKARSARAIAAAELDFAWLGAIPESDAIATLTALPGVGPWTAQIYLMFYEGRPDAFAPGDLALQEAARMLYDLPERPAAKALAAQAEAWSPWRAVAARALWAYYAQAKRREGVQA